MTSETESTGKSPRKRAPLFLGVSMCILAALFVGVSAFAMATRTSGREFRSPEWRLGGSHFLFLISGSHGRFVLGIERRSSEWKCASYYPHGAYVEGAEQYFSSMGILAYDHEFRRHDRPDAEFPTKGLECPRREPVAVGDGYSWSSADPISVPTAVGRILLIWFPAWISILVLGTPPGIFFVSRMGRRLKRKMTGACIRCGYNLTGNVSGVCPEYGTTIRCRPVGLESRPR